MMLKNILLASAALLVTLTAHGAKPSAPVKIESNIPAPLSSNQPGEIVITLVPLAASDQLKVVFRSEAGLNLQSPVSYEFTSPTAGTPLTQSLTVLAAREGRFNISAIVTMVSGNISSARAISIPVVVGDPSKLEKQRTKPSPCDDAIEECIKSLPALESAR